MRNTSALYRTLLVALLASSAVASAQRATDDQERVATPPSPTITTAQQAVAQKRVLISRDVSEFRALHNPVISSDGAWMAAEERPDRGDGNVRVWSTEGDVTFTIERGQNPRISPDSRWVSVLQAPPLEDSRTVESRHERADRTLVLLNTQDGSRRTFDFVLSYDVTYSSTWLVYLQSRESMADEAGHSNDETTAKPAAKERKGGTLHMVHLESDKVVTTENVSQHASPVPAAVRRESDQTADHFAYVLHDEETGRDTLRICILFGDGLSGIRAWYEGENIGGLCWARDTVTLGFIDSTETTGEGGKRRVNRALYTWELSSENRRDAPVVEEFTRVRDISDHRALHNLVISADGAWMVAEERPDRGDGNVRVWATQRDLTFSIERGQNPRFSRDARWVSALQKPPLEGSRTARPTNKRAGQTLVLLDLQDGSRRTFDFVLSYDMTYSSTYLLYLQSPETKADEKGPSKDEATRPAIKERKVGALHQVPINPARLARTLRPYVPGRMFTKENVVEFVTHPANDHFAYVFHDEETSGDTLHIIKWGIRAWYHGDTIEGLSWARGADGGDDSIILGFLNCTETTGEDGKRRVNSALYTWQPAQSSEEQFTRVDTPQ